MAIEDMTTDEFRERLKERVLRQEEATDESSVRVQEMLKSIDRLSDERIKNLQDMESMSKNLEERDNKFEGGSMLVPPEREQYSLGGALTKLGKLASKKLDEAQGITEKTAGRTSEDRGVVVGKDRTKAYKNTEQVKGAAMGSLLSVGAAKAWEDENDKKPTKKQATAFEEAFSSAHNAGEETFIFKGKEYNTEVRKGKAKGGKFPDLTGDGEVTQADILKGRGVYQEGGEASMLVPPEMPVDTYPNIAPEDMAEVEASQQPDDVMEEEYENFIMTEAITPEEQEYLTVALNSDPRLEEIFDKILNVATEFSGAGEVEGPGTGVSDSIPARLSDGEFVMTRKATDQIGADNLQMMMDDAERAYDGGLQRKEYELGGLLEKPEEDGLTADQTEKLVRQKMINADRMPSIQR
tara:strand:+ start:8323 stop:9552 length:1230 start_codon:yes stop_codon:yes gene_type:complete